MPKKRADGRYELKVRISKPNEPRRYKAVYGSTLREAQERKRQLEAEVQAGIDHSTRPSVTALCDYWLSLRSQELRPQTVQNYRHALQHITALMGDKDARSVTVDDARDAISRISTDISPYQGIRARKMIAMVYDDAITRSVLSSNPWKAVPLPKHKTEGKRPLTEEELAKLEQAPLTPSDRALVSVLRYTGLRIGEAVALQAQDINFSSGYITVTKTAVEGVIFPPKTEAGKRSIPMPKVLSEILKPYVAMFEPGEYLFSHNGERPWTKGTIWRHFEEIKRVADMPDDFSPHIFRHTYTHSLIVNGIPPLTAQVLLGHSSYAITLNTYAHYGWKDVQTDAVTRIFDSAEDKSSSKRSSE